MPTRPGGVLLLVVLLPATISAILDPVDFLALQEIRSALSDLPGSAFFSGWDFSYDPCGFPGVLCVHDRVVSLSLGDPIAGSPGLSGELHPSLSHLVFLTELSLVPGRVSGDIPTSISSLTNLRFLALARNQLTGAIPFSFSSLHNLRTLDLSSNLFSGEIPASIGSLPSLVNLILSHNRLSGAVPRFSSPSLVRLDLKHNSLTGPVTSLPSSLQYLSLSSNLLSGPISFFLRPLRRLVYLDLGMNHFSGTIPSFVFSLPLYSLQLQRNALWGPVEPNGEVVIKLVDLSYNMLWGRISPHLAGADRLYLNSNRFWGDLPAEVSKRVVDGGMEILYVQHNFLTGVAGMTTTRGVAQRSSVCLEYNCMVVPVVERCPASSGPAKSRPAGQCRGWRA